MSLQGALNAAISALSAQSTALSTISDNLANSQTTAYKSSSTSFSSLVAGSGSNSSGGVSASVVSNVDQQGLLVQSTEATHLAIEGDGFFIVSEGTDATSTYYTRNGEFTVDSEGYLTNGEYYLLGWATDVDGNPISGTSENALEPIDLDSVQSSVDATTSVEFQANLPADAAVGDSFETTFEVYDSLGTTSTVTATYEKTAENTWEITYSDPTLSSTGETVGTVTSDPVEVTFNEDGTLASTDPNPAVLTIEDWTTGAEDSTISLDLGETNGTDGLTQYASDDGEPAIDVQSIDQDGLAYGNLSSIEIADDGSVIAFFDNGEERPIYQIPVATFGNPDGLDEMSSGIYARSSSSGNATLHEPGEGGAGTVQGGWLEASTVDTGDEFSKMLSAQQAYSAASQIMSTANDMFDTLIDAVR
ncbi:MAG: flagellar hook protein FlgE [Roseibium sp.]|uniref:flagellar hook protein FlgE n=1 Tax=Roseibium sp. TaxID=1936156 RepID=UPI002635FA7E|nr:flagellar hook protein FlgE [Roseibium sp.]MCV0424223.1 flagellar hook protein FlgE [Roseibium sp.]